MLRRHYLHFIYLSALFGSPSYARADVFHMGPGLTSLELVTVGNPGNASDVRYHTPDGPPGFGSVDHVYNIGKFEITAGQYTEFLNAVAKDDPYELYNLSMSDPHGSIITGGPIGAYIRRTGFPGNRVYSVLPDWANRPVNYVSFWDAVRFCNWLHNGQPMGPEGPATTEDGAYHDVGDQTLFGRNLGARFFIPTEDEWYKAAYHDSKAGLAASYFDYPTSSNTMPGNTLPDPGNNANYRLGFTGYAIGGPYWRTQAGEFVNSASPYGTFDQGGNIYEWNETSLYTTRRGLRGGSFYTSTLNMQASYRDNDEPTSETSVVGFRIAAAVPEPSTTALAVIACGLIGWSRKHFAA